MSSKKEIFQKNKKENYKVVVTTRIEKARVTTRIKGSDKNKFLDDCIQRGKAESDVARSIINIYYDIIDSDPALKGKEFDEIKKNILKKLLRPNLDI